MKSRWHYICASKTSEHIQNKLKVRTKKQKPAKNE